MSDHPANLLLMGSDSYDDLKQRVCASGGLVVLDFFAPWCGPCQRLVGELPKFAAQFPNVIFIKVNVDDCKDLAGRFNVSSIPHVTFAKGENGEIKQLGTVVGFNMAGIKDSITKFS